MTALRFYGNQPPGVSDEPLPGRLIVIEGVDGVGRSTQIALLREWLEARGYGVVHTGLTRSALAGRGIQRAKRGHTLDPITLNLLYATDFWDRLERQIIPALQAGMVALVDRSSHGTCKLVAEKLWSTEISLPPLAEQHRIVAKVDELMALCDQLEAARQQRSRARRAAIFSALRTLGVTPKATTTMDGTTSTARIRSPHRATPP